MPRSTKSAQDSEMTSQKAVEESEDQEPAQELKKTCNVPGCKQEPEFRGLCGAHWMTHRGLGDPKEEK